MYHTFKPICRYVSVGFLAGMLTTSVCWGSTDNTQQKQLAELQRKMAALEAGYNQRLNAMQKTIDTLQAEVHLNPPSVPNAQDIGDQLIFGNEPQASQAAPSKQDIGDQLIFGSATQKTASQTSTQEIQSLGSGAQPSVPGRVGQSASPDIIVSGDFIGHTASRSDMPDKNRFSLRETEFGFSSAIDPYARGTFIFSKPDDGPLAVEEGYVTLLDLPWGLQSKVGKFRSTFGKLNNVHDHDLPQTDRPDVLTNFLGSDGLIETGINVSKILPTPWYSDVTMEVSNGDTAPLFNHGRLTKPLLVDHWKNFFELSESKTLEVGLSSALGARDTANQGRDSAVEGIDLTYRWLPPAQFHGFIWQTELLGAQEEQPISGKQNLFGGYSFLEYKLNNRWNAGVRFDYSQIPLLANASDWAIVPYVDFWQSEFGRLRLEYKQIFGHNYQSSEQAWVQYSVILGTHPPHTF